MTDTSEIQWRVIGYVQVPGPAALPPMIAPNTWEARYRGGYLVLHANESGAETMVWVPGEANDAAAE